MSTSPDRGIAGQVNMLYLAIRLWAAAVARADERRIELALDHRLNELAHSIPQTGFDRIKPVIEKMLRRLHF